MPEKKQPRLVTQRLSKKQRDNEGLGVAVFLFAYSIVSALGWIRQLRRNGGRRMGMGETTWRMLVVGIVLWAGPAWAALDISPAFLGMYRKTIVIENELFTHATRVGVDPRVARAVVIQDSGGNGRPLSGTKARSYFQIPPNMLRSLGAQTNIEAGLKYLAQLQSQYDREDIVLAAYYAGPEAVVDNRPLRLDTLQYVLSVSLYKAVLERYEPEVRRQAEALSLRQAGKADSWETLARTTGISASVLRMYNPFLAAQPLPAGAQIVYPASAPASFLEYEAGSVYYTSRIGDSYVRIAQTLGVDLESFRRDNDLWQLQQLPVGIRLRATVPTVSPFYQFASKSNRARGTAIAQRRSQSSAGQPDGQTPRHRIKRGETLEKIARRYGTTVSALMRANNLRSSRIHAGTWLVIPGSENSIGRSVTQTPRQHRIKRGETLEKIARRYGTTVSALMRANNLRSSRIHAGATLVIPTGGSAGRAVTRAPRRHRVRWGETLGKIARRYRTTVSALMRANNLRSSRIYAGALLLIPR